MLAQPSESIAIGWYILSEPVSLEHIQDTKESREMCVLSAHVETAWLTQTVDTDTALCRQAVKGLTSSTFMPHKDTPHSENIFGSLVIVFPIEHQGGDLILADGKQCWTFKGEYHVSHEVLPDTLVSMPIADRFAVVNSAMVEHMEGPRFKRDSERTLSSALALSGHLAPKGKKLRRAHFSGENKSTSAYEVQDLKGSDAYRKTYKRTEREALSRWRAA
ncbi:hypothetical protein F5890DRAFT_1470757 [Lentinula detonsa]|uniref:Uncharacterized protein n=1 Tax=Lentinula detonsa TaxID=2804962 RepID=A0AA38UWG1_9AGAR|nr:hypothetical protein F5890DRAFT_1470757 [Lentinula detonsa]